MNGALIIGVIAGVAILVALVAAIAVTVSRRQTTPPPPHEVTGRGPTGQHPDPIEGTPSDTSVPHWDRRIDPREGPQ